MVSDKKISKIFYLEYIGKISPTLAAMFFAESWLLEQSWHRVTKATFLPSNIEIGQVVSEKKNFQIFYTDIYGK